MVRARKHGSMNVVSYLNNSFMYCKVANTVLWFSAWKPYGFAFAFFFLLQAFLLPEPLYSGPEKIIYFRDESLFKAEVEKKGTSWLIEFYTTWNPACVNFAPVFSELSSKYGLPNFQFGKVDVGRFPALGHDFGISDSAFSKQLPTLILFKNGTPNMMRPTADSKGKLIKFHMNMETIVTEFDLNNLHNELKVTAAASKKSNQHPKAE